MLVEISKIVVPEERQRKEFLPGKIAELQQSFRAIANGRSAVEGQLQPIVITRDFQLVAGERRLRAMKELSDVIQAVFVDETDPVRLQLLELEENVKREDLKWQELAVAVCTFHTKQLTLNKAWSLADTAKALNIAGASTASKYIAVGKAVLADDDRVLSTGSMNAAYNVVSRQQQRMVDAELSKLDENALANLPLGDVEFPSEEGDVWEDEPESDVTLPDDLVLDLPPLTLETGVQPPKVTPAAKTAPVPKPVEPPPPPAVVDNIAEANFLELLPHWPFGKFNLLHCDFPYGVNHGKSRMGAAQAHGGYEDSPEVYWALCEGLANNIDKILQPSAHVLFWFSFNYYTKTVEFFRKNTDLEVQPFPLLWVKSNGQGLVPDTARQPRRVYESALLMSRGDRKILQTKANVISHPQGKKLHLSEKPKTVLAHFFHMLVDGSTELLDPTCGSGSALAAAAQFRPNRSLGIELNPEFAETARTEVRKSLVQLEGG